MRLLWYSNAPWAGTGYGTQTAQAVRRIKALGHEVAIANNYGMQAGQVTWEGVPILAQGYDGHSRDVLLAHADAYKPDWVLTLYDVWVFQPLELYRGKRFASWVPVDCDPIPDGVLAWCKEHLAIAMSQFGQAQLRAAGVDARYVPHAIDRTIYQPTPTDIRRRWDVPDDAFVVMVNAANKGLPPRKAWPEMFDAFARFSERHDDAYLFLNTELTGIVGGLPLQLAMVRYGIRPERVRIAPQYEYATHKISPQAVAAYYSASDVLLATSMGEGFGLAVLEAQACGTPAIVTDFTAQPELLGAGWKVGYQRYYHSGHGTFWATPLVTEIDAALEAAYEAKGDTALRARGIEFAAEYDADTVFERHWKPVIAEMEADLAPPKKRQGMSNAARRRARRAA